MRALLVAAALLGACGSAPPRCPWAPETGLPCPVCRPRGELEALGEDVSLPSLRRPPRRDRVAFWSGASLPEQPPAPSTYVRCRPCDCAETATLAPWDEWDEINRSAYAKLRTASAPYPVAIVPGFHGGGYILRYRVRIALRLLRQGWVSALVLSGGHRRGGANEARQMLDAAREMAQSEHVDVADRLFVEPCACHTTTNLRNALRLMAAMKLPSGLLVTDSKVSGQASVFSTDLESLVAEDLDCPVGRVAHMLGTTSLQRFPGSSNGCRSTFGFRHNPIFFAVPRREPVVYWVSPFQTLRGTRLSALDCGPGSARIRACEPDDQDPFTSACLPALVGDGRCTR